MNSSTKNNLAWKSIFDKHNILEQISKSGHVIISATQINEFREARLMTKFDHKSQLPELFSSNHLSILPTSRGGYVIGTFETFHDFNLDDIDTERIVFPTFLESLNYREITSEATAINCAFVCKILHNFTEEENLFPTVSGRMSSSNFNFLINTNKEKFKIEVGNSQIEIDGGYEGDSSLNLIEAKNYISNDFLVRQLYYPYKLWKSKVSKKVRPIFLTYTNGTFHLREYMFEDVDHYNSIKLIKQKKYAIQEGSINLETIQEILNTTSIVKEPNIPFPQADSFERVINLCELLYQKQFIAKEEITTNYDFNARQTDYYGNAAKYIGYVEFKNVNNQIGCVLSDEGKQIFNVSIFERQLCFVKSILSHLAFNKTLSLYLTNGEMPSVEEIVEIMMDSNLYNINEKSTYYRRASTISGWVNWILNLIEE